MRNRRVAKAEPLVTDQPGRKIVFAGLILSVLLGFFVRGLTRPEILQAELKRSVSKIHATTQVNWGAAELSLRDGIWPRLSVLVSDVKIVSSEHCWGQPLLYAQEFELPLSIWSLFVTGQPLREIIVKNAFLEFKGPFVCEKNIVETKSHDETLPSPRPFVRLKPKKESREAPPLVLTRFSFLNLKVRNAEWSFPDWNFKTLDLNVKENNPWYAEINSSFSIPDLEGIETGAVLSAVYKEFPSQFFEARFEGFWREGAFEIKTIWEGPQKGWTYQSSFNHIPFQLLKTIAQRTKTPWNWPNSPMWFSFTTQSVLPFTTWEKSQHFVRGIQVEGDLGTLSIPDLQVKSAKPFKVLPFAFALEQADLNSVYEKELKSLDFLSSLGKLSGQGQWISEKNLFFTGSLDSLELPFFHRDQRVVQVIQSLDIKAELKEGNWTLVSENWKLQKGEASGLIKLESNQNVSAGQLQVNFDKLMLNPDVLTAMDIVTPDLNLQGKLNAKWKSPQGLELNFQGKTEQLETRSLRFDKPQFIVRRQNQVWDYRLVSPSWSIRELSFGVLSSKVDSNLEFPLDGKNLNLQGTVDETGQLKWSLNSLGIRSSGSISREGLLKGSLAVSRKNQERNLEISGSRQSPQFLLLK